MARRNPSGLALAAHLSTASSDEIHLRHGGGGLYPVECDMRPDTTGALMVRRLPETASDESNEFVLGPKR